MLLIAAAGNDAISNDDLAAAGWANLPTSLDADVILAVGASGVEDELTEFSNYGKQHVDLVAPGVDMLSTWLHGGYAHLSGE